MNSAFDIVTGGAGFIGSNLSDRLLSSGRHVRVVDNLFSGRLENLSGFDQRYREAFEFLQIDIRDVEQLHEAFRGCTTVYHLAAIPSVQHSIDDPAESNSVNVDGTLNVLTAAREAGVSKVVIASSCAVYGDTEVLPVHERLPIDPLSPYAVTKYCDELYAEVYSRVFDLPCLCLRYFNVFGPRQDPGSDYAAVVPKFITRMLGGKPPLIFGDGEQSRDFIFVENVAAANILAAGSDARAMAINIGTGEQRTLNELVSTLNDILGTDFEPIYEPVRPGDIRKSVSEISLAREVLDFEPGVSFEQGLARTVEWFSKRTG